MNVLQTTLLVATILSALAVVWVKFNTRMLFNEIYHLEKSISDQDQEWDKLKLEQTTLIEHNRIEHIARQKLELMQPEPVSIIYITLN